MDGIENFSFLPAGTLLWAGDDCVLRVEEQNAPCWQTAKAVAERYPDRDDIEHAFVKAATGLRGIVASVDRPGAVPAGVRVKAMIPKQWIY